MIQSEFSGLALRPSNPDDPGSDIIQDQGHPEALEFQWGFVQLGPNLYRIFNAMSGLCAVATKAEADIRLQQFGWNEFVHQWIYQIPVDPNQPSRVKFLSPDQTLAWSNQKIKDPGSEITLQAVENQLYEEWLLTRIANVEVGKGVAT